MPKDFARSDRVAEVIQRELINIILKEVNDPRLPRFVSISNVQVSPDLSHASVYISVLGNKEEADKTVEILTHAAGFLRSKLGRRVKLRIVPQLRFIYDTSIEYTSHLLKVIDDAVAKGQADDDDDE